MFGFTLDLRLPFQVRHLGDDRVASQNNVVVVVVVVVVYGGRRYQGGITVNKSE